MSGYKVEICGVNTSKLPLLTTEEKDELFRRIMDGDKQAREDYIKGNLRLVLSVIQRFAGSNENVDDLFQIGCIGLIKAIATVDTEKGRLSTYAARCIENAILSQMRLWLRIDLLREKKNQNGVFLRKLPRICISFAPLRTVM